MPLLDSASPEAFKKNIAREVESQKAKGHSPHKAAQIAAAIAYRVKRRAAAKRRRRT